MIKHILFPSDASKNSQWAFEHLVLLAKTLKAKITLLHNYALLNVTRPEALDACETEGSGLEDIEAQLKAQGLNDLKELGQILESEAIIYELLQVRGHIGEQIIKIALEQSVDLILMGNRGLSTIEAFTLGSNSTYVLHNSECPVLIIPWPQNNSG